MFRELAPYLRQRAVLMTVTYVSEDQLRVNVIPQKTKDGENTALTTPLSITGTAEELDQDLPSTLVTFISAHLQLKNTLERAQAEMDAAAKAAKAEVSAKKTSTRKEMPKSEADAKAELARTSEPVKPELATTGSLFEASEPTIPSAVAVAQTAEEADILAEIDEAQREQQESWEEAA